MLGLCIYILTIGAVVCYKERSTHNEGNPPLNHPGDGYGVSEFARLAGVSRQWLHQLCRQGRGPKRVSVRAPDKRGRISMKRGRVLIPKSEGDQWIATYRPTRLQ